MKVINNRKRIALCNDALLSLKHIIPEHDFKEADDYINQHGEWGLGIEYIIDHLTEEEITINEAQYEKIRIAMSAMGLDNSSRLNYLQKHNVNNSFKFIPLASPAPSDALTHAA